MKIKLLNGWIGSMKINTFQADLQFYPFIFDVCTKIKIEFVKSVNKHMVERTNEIFSDFSNACNLGMLCGEDYSPIFSSADETLYEAKENRIEWSSRLINIDKGSLRVLIGMFRGEILFDHEISVFYTFPESIVENAELIQTNDEKSMSLPGLFQLSIFCLLHSH